MQFGVVVPSPNMSHGLMGRRLSDSRHFGVSKPPDRRAGRQSPGGVLAHGDDAVLAEGRRLLIGRPGPLRAMCRPICVDEHTGRHTRRSEKCVTVIIDLTPSATAPARPGCWT